MSKVSVEYVLEKLEAILENPDIKTKDKLVAIKMCGDYLKMFEKQQKLQVDIRGLITRLDDDDLKRIAGRPIQQVAGSRIIDCVPDDQPICSGLQLPEAGGVGAQDDNAGNGGERPRRKDRHRRRVDQEGIDAEQE